MKRRRRRRRRRRTRTRVVKSSFSWLGNLCIEEDEEHELSMLSRSAVDDAVEIEEEDEPTYLQVGDVCSFCLCESLLIPGPGVRR